MKKISLICVISLLCILSACEREKHVFKPEPVVGYYPLTVGSFWKYSSIHAWLEYDLFKEVVSLDTAHGGMEAFKIRYVWTYRFQDTTRNQAEWFTYEALVGTEIRELYDLEDTSRYEIILRLPIRVGDAWQRPPEQKDSVMEISAYYDSVTAFEAVVTPAGDFDDCFRITRVSLWDNLEYLEQEKWLKPHVGFVRYWNSTETFGLTYSLEDYKIIAK